MTAPEPNIYTTIIIDEAQRRGISVELLDPDTGEMDLTFDGRTVRTIQSLSERVSALAFLNCSDKQRTRNLLRAAGLRVPKGRIASGDTSDREFVRSVDRAVVKPARGEGGEGITVGVGEDDLRDAIARAREHCPDVVIEELCDGADLRILIIDDEVVAAAERRRPHILGDGGRTVAELVHERNDGADYAVPLDEVTVAYLASSGVAPDDVPDDGARVDLRGTANVHTGGSIHDVTADVSETLRSAAIATARTVGVPVAGVDLLVPDVEGEEYVVIEVNEQPGLANHEPHPTAARFIDHLFPESVDR